ncbi:MAG: pro-sigmaK processing inhibitor BofA family protein [Clostridia bacterium]|nr:pro-sigmaK processing inhibitor BofA family protein [Clostridia bacterium]
MDSANIFIIAVCVVAAIIVLWIFKKSEHFYKSLFLSAVSGVGGLFFVNIISALTGVSLAVNPFTIGFSALSGLSGVIALLVCNLLAL